MPSLRESLHRPAPTSKKALWPEMKQLASLASAAHIAHHRHRLTSCHSAAMSACRIANPRRRLSAKLKLPSRNACSASPSPALWHLAQRRAVCPHVGARVPPSASSALARRPRNEASAQRFDLLLRAARRCRGGLHGNHFACSR